jgi:hypothetical protein
MKLLLRRDQKTTLMGKAAFTLDVRADLSESELASIRKYRFGDTMLYESHIMTDRGSGLIGLASRLAWKAVTLNISVDDLAKGKRVEVKDIVEMLAIEEHIKEAAKTFAAILAAAATFGGEEIVEI